MFKNLTRALIIGVLLSTTALVAMPTNASAAGCDARGIGSRTDTHNTNNSAYTIKNGKATVTFKVTGTNCNLDVTIIAWKAPNGTTGKPFSQQKLYAHTTGKFSTGIHTLTVDLPDCYFQVDTVTGTKLTGSTGGAHNYDSRMVAFMHGGTQKCVDKPKPPVTPPVTPPATPPTPPATTVSAPTTPEVLPNTGIGGAALGLGGLATISGIGISQIRARRQLRRKD